MTFDPDDYLPEPNNWFETEITYSGTGRAEFLNPKGWIEGPVEIHFDEVGNSSVVMIEVANFHCEKALGTKHRDNDLAYLLNGRMPEITGEMVTHSFGMEPKNSCSQLVVKTKNGTFEVIDKEVTYVSWGVLNGGRVIFYPRVSQFRLRDVQEPNYWIMPLVNFVSEVGIRQPYNRLTSLDYHPLRLHRMPELPTCFGADEIQSLIWSVNSSGNRYIPFQFINAPGFIDPLLDFEDRKKDLQEGRARILVTAVMVGDIGDNNTDWEGVKSWIPLDYLQLLSLATGSLVGIPWIEFRDDTGHLVSRIHTKQWQFPFLPGHQAVTPLMGGGIGWLLSQAPNTLPSEVRTAIQLTVMGGFKDFHIEERKSFFFRAFDTLTKKHRQKTQPVTFDTKRQGVIKNLLITTRDKILKQKHSGDKKAVKEAIDRIAGKVFDADEPRTVGDVEAILDFLDEIGLHDAEVIRNTISQKKWIGKYKKYRGEVIHEGRIRNDGSDRELKEIVQFSEHLHDILIRALLKMVNYDGQYKRVIRLREDKSVDWVQSDMTENDLGYT